MQRQFLLEELVGTRRSPARHGVVAFGELVEEIRDLRRIVLQIAVHGDDDLAAGVVEPGRQGGRLAVVPTQVDADDPWVGLTQLLQDAGRGVAAPVIDKNRLPRLFARLERLRNPPVELPQARLLVVQRDNDETSGVSTPLGSSVRRGWNASDTHPLSFDDVRVPEENLLGERGRGYANFLRILDEGRIAIAALSVGAAQGCVDESVKYARERSAFGQPIGKYQAIEFKLARMEARAHAARTAYYDAAALMLAGKPFKKEAAVAKMVASEAAMDNARDATQIHGGYGFMNEYTVARHYRDSKILEIGEGTTEVQLMIIARQMGL